MDIKTLTEMEKRALAKISTVIYGKELTLLMLPELKDYLNGTGDGNEFLDADIPGGVKT